ncbi:MAG TPA: calcium/sodium antiporter [Longimicrobiales bacterium]|nr:calcium/sodium antiporter [Longimicrobiales bacterium]
MLLLNVALFGIGLVGLYLGAEWLVRGSARLARRHGMSPLVVGLTVVAFGSSAPELLVGVVASLQGRSEVVLGNVVGSNILNIALILGISAMVRPLKTELRLLAREAPLMVVISVVVAVMMLDGAIGRVDGVLLLAGFVGFLWFVLRAAPREPKSVAAEYIHYEETERGAEAGTDGRDLLLVVAGLSGLVVGAQFLVMSAVFFARLLGISEVLIGMTVVAVGTSLPELATCVVAAFRSEPDIALGNAVGSNIFNLLSILAISGLIRPIPVPADVLAYEIPAMLFFAILLVPLAWKGRVLGRVSGGILLSGYVVFTTILIARAIP